MATKTRPIDIASRAMTTVAPINKSKALLLTLLGAHLVNDFYGTVLPAFLPSVAEEFDLNYTELGVLSFAFTILTGVLQPVIGNLADRTGRRRTVLVFGFVIGAVGFVAMSLAQSFWFIVGVSLLAGLAAATYHPQATSFIVNAYPRTRGKMLGLHGWGGSGGHFLAPAVVVLTVAAFGWRIAMAAIAVPMLVTAVVLQSRLEETEPNPQVTIRGAISRDLLLVAAAFGVVSMVGRSFLTFFVKMLVDEGWEETRAGVLLTIILLGGVIAQPLGGWAYDKVGGRTVFSVAIGATVILITAFGLTDGAVSLVAFAGVAFFQFSLFPVSMAQASQLASSSQTGAATGVVFGISGLMSASAQPVVGALAEATGDVRVALFWLLPVSMVGLVLARLMPQPA